MSTKTTNYQFVKPELKDTANITAMNPNWDTIDTTLKGHADKLGSVDKSIEQINTTLDENFDEINETLDQLESDFDNKLANVTSSLCVTLTGTIEGGYTTNVTFTAISQAHSKGDRVYAQDSEGRVFNLVAMYSDYAMFESSEGMVAYSLAIGSDNSIITDVAVPTSVRSNRVVVGTTTKGWTEADCDFLCDGTADQEEINDALFALPPTGGEVILLDGTYNISDNIRLTQTNEILRGNGIGTKIVRAFASDSSTYGGVINVEKDGCTVRDLQVDGQNATYTEVYNYGINIKGANCTVENTIVNNCSFGIKANEAQALRVTNNRCNGNTKAAIDIYNGDNHVVSNNTVMGNGDYGIDIEETDNTVIMGNAVCNNSESGITLNYTTGCVVSGNTVNGNGYDGISLYNSSKNTITGNTCNGNLNECGVWMRDTHYCTITGNTLLDNAAYAVYFNTTCNYNIVRGNNTMGAAVNVSNGTDNKLDSEVNITAGTTDLTAGTSPLATGAIYLVYE